MHNIMKRSIQIFELLFFAIPLLITVYFILSYILSMFLGIDVSNTKTPLELWKEVRNVFWPFYIGVGGIGLYLFERSKPVDTVRRNLFLKRLFFGVLFLIFSYAIAGIIVDLGYLVTFFFLYLFK